MEKAVEATRRELSEKIARQTELNAELEQKIAAQDQVLYDLANLSKEEAKEIVLKKLDQELVEEQGALILKHEKKTAERCEEQAREALLSALQRYAAAHTAESTTSTVDIPNDDMKGRAHPDP